MVEILRAVNLEELEIDRLILQPNSDQMEMRLALAADGWAIVYERLVACGGRCYVVIVCERSDAELSLTRSEALLGPFLMQTPSDLLYQTWCGLMSDLIRTKVEGLRRGGVRAAELATAEADLATFSEILD